MTQAIRPRRGEIWYAALPGQPDDPHQPRPALVVSSDIRNRVADDVMVVPIFSRGRTGPTRVTLRAPAGGIPHDSVLYCDELTTIDLDFLSNGPLGLPVSDRILDQVVQAIIDAVAL